MISDLAVYKNITIWSPSKVTKADVNSREFPIPENLENPAAPQVSLTYLIASLALLQQRVLSPAKIECIGPSNEKSYFFSILSIIW